MACGSCKKRRESRQDTLTPDYERIFDNYKYLTYRQINARLDRYKKDFCKDCKDRYNCSFDNFVKCKHIELKK